MESCENKGLVTRRGLIGRSALALGGLALPVGCRRPANQRITLGCIGMGKMGVQVMNSFLQDPRVQVVAVCDVNEESDGYWHNETFGREPGRRVVDDFYGRAWNSLKGGSSACSAYVDYREMLEKEDLDAVLISTPNHWHALQAIAAADKGIHVYGQKPLARTIGEGRAICQAVETSGIVWQTGSQQRSDQYFRKACELVRNGRLGKVDRVEITLPGGNPNYSRRGKEKATVAVPKGFDFDLWLGPAPVADYCPARTHANWRWNWDYAGGNVTDFGAHHIDIALWGLGLEHTGPSEIRIIDAEVPEPGELYNTPFKFHFEVDLPGGTALVVKDAKHHEVEGGVRFIGENGDWIWCDRSGFKAEPRSLAGSLAESDVRLHQSHHHEEDFVTAIESKASGGAGATVAPVEAAQRAISIAHLANIAMRLGLPQIQWNAANEMIVGAGAAEARAYIAQPMRSPWSL